RGIRLEEQRNQVGFVKPRNRTGEDLVGARTSHADAFSAYDRSRWLAQICRLDANVSGDTRVVSQRVRFSRPSGSQMKGLPARFSKANAQPRNNHHEKRGELNK